MMSVYLDLVKPTYIENWPTALCRLSFAQVDVPLTLAEARAIGYHIVEYGEGFIPVTAEQEAQKEAAYAWTHRAMAATFCETDPGPKAEMPDITPSPIWVQEQKATFAVVHDRVAQALTKFPKGAVIRLGSRSPKDSWSWISDGPKLVAGDDPFKHLLDCSERMYEDLFLALQNDYSPHIFVREWVDIPKWAEFRCFLRNKKLVGASQYYYHQHFSELVTHHDLIRYWLQHYVNNYLGPACSSFEAVIFDVAAIITNRVSDKGTEVNIEFKLVEINPFFELTDPCLFDWRKGGDFDGTFRFLAPDKTVISI